MKPILEIRNLAKSYNIAHERQPYLTFRDKLTGIFKRSEQTEEFWALQDVSFDVMPGESIGIIGRNGAGKSTLLKILSRITPPTKGTVVARGRIASLLEVGTGFHQELTGRENIFMNGSILGMKNTEIKAKFDEIVDFSGVEKFLDTPLKNYSSGMQLRLAFAVAAHLEPEILIIDEVLAVGDAEFQKKCIGKMGDVSKSGRTILFVSHSLPSLRAICNTGLLLEQGKLAKAGTIEQVILSYTTLPTGQRTVSESIKHFRPTEKISNLLVNQSTNPHLVVSGKQLTFSFNANFERRLQFEFQLHVKKDNVNIASYSNFVKNEALTFEAGTYSFQYTIQLPDLRSGIYGLDVYFAEAHVAWFAAVAEQIELQLINSDHNTFLSQESFNWWGHNLLDGQFQYQAIHTMANDLIKQ